MMFNMSVRQNKRDTYLFKIKCFEVSVNFIGVL